MNDTIAEYGRRALGNQRLDRPSLLTLAALCDGHWSDVLYWAGRIRHTHFGRRVRMCCIVPGKLGACSEDCKWCAQSAKSAPGVILPRRTPRREILAAATKAASCGAGRIGIVNSGRGPTDRDLDEVADAVGALGEAGVSACASLGELTPQQAQRLARSGVRMYHHNLETSRRHFPSVVTTHGYDERIATLKAARAAGLRICSGGLFGIGETWEDRIDLALTLRDEVGPDCIPLNFLHPIAGTPLAGATPLAPMEILRIIAMFRFALPRTDLKVAGGRQVNLRDMQSWIFAAGATSLMTGDYLTTRGRSTEDDLQMLADLGMEVVREFE